MSFTPPPNFRLSNTMLKHADVKHADLSLMRAPKSFDIRNLNGVEYLPGEITNIEVPDANSNGDEVTYQLGAFSGHGLDMASMVSKKGDLIVGKPLKGLLSLTKTFSVEQHHSQNPQTLSQTKHRVPMPTGLKERFTPFGAGNPVKTPKLALHTKKRKRNQDSETSTDELSPKKKKKRKKDTEKASVIETPTTQQALRSPKKPKRIKQESDGEDFKFVTQSPKTPSEGLSDKVQRKIKKEKLSDNSVLSLTSETAVTSDTDRISGAVPVLENGYHGKQSSEDPSSPSKSHKKKKKKDKSRKSDTEREEIVSMALSNGVGGQQIDVDIKKVKKEKKLKSSSSSLNDSAMIDASGDASSLSLSVIEGGTRSPKTSQRKPSENAVDISVDSSFASDINDSLKKKKKKKKHKHEVDL